MFRCVCLEKLIVGTRLPIRFECKSPRYLNDVPVGGETNFPMADTPKAPRTMKKCEQGLMVKPQKGAAVMWSCSKLFIDEGVVNACVGNEYCMAYRLMRICRPKVGV